MKRESKTPQQFSLRNSQPKLQQQSSMKTLSAKPTSAGNRSLDNTSSRKELKKIVQTAEPSLKKVTSIQSFYFEQASSISSANKPELFKSNTFDLNISEATPDALRDQHINIPSAFKHPRSTKTSSQKSSNPEMSSHSKDVKHQVVLESIYQELIKMRLSVDSMKNRIQTLVEERNEVVLHRICD